MTVDTINPSALITNKKESKVVSRLSVNTKIQRVIPV